LKVREEGSGEKAKHWPKRYAELRKAKLTIFEANEQQQKTTTSPTSSSGFRELYHYTTLSMTLLQFPNHSGVKKKANLRFSITTSGGVRTFKATSLHERDRWLAELRRLVPLVKMEADQEMIQKVFLSFL